MEFLEPLQILWDYLRLDEPLEKADCIVGFGNFNTDIARRAMSVLKLPKPTMQSAPDGAWCRHR